MRLNDLSLGAASAALGTTLIVVAKGFPDMAGMTYGPGFFPSLIGAGFILAGLGLGASAVLRRKAKPGASAPPERWVRWPEWFSDRLAVARAMGVLVAVVVCVLGAPWLGTIAVLAAVLLGLMLLLGARWQAALPIAVILPFALHGLFGNVLRVPLPRGLVENWLF